MSTPRPYLARTPVALAHRGGALYGPNVGLENTMTAFGNAVDLGYTHLETDVHLTRDGRIVAFHDDRLDRVTDRTGLIRDLPWSEVASARLVGDHAEEAIPLLTDVIDAFPGINLNIDLKAPGTAGPLWRLIEERGLHDRVCVGSFSQRSLSHFRRLARGRVATAAGQIGTALAVLAPRMLSAVLRTPADVFQVPTSVPLRGRTVEVVTPKLIEVAHAHGKQVHVWTIDDAGEMERLLELGVDGLVSDRIDVLKDVLTRRGVWTGRD
ncbi:glycerophosphodiester phosphodiesterase [Intrasporangium oryzae NRRL B-24470]|uniref:Glycerophosphodiester phosphodiesterase n=1 Tax=Intrasporangium oryzae NRRL B-24470 TaxID=1386089 RepID=W9G0P6_9MICO|nr:glycerophosphodiester phosphodiesterase [Intrasporangium oryzae]EWS99645.1 glycerophosphodiester phosphodiesterase [Intrasporangium oryzae NRRL B-24470]